METLTNKTDLQVDVLSGSARSMEGSGCQCNQNLPFEQCIISMPNGSCTEPCDNHQVLLLPLDFSHEFVNATSKILVHPPQLPGIALLVSFTSCTNGTVLVDSQGCVCQLSAYNAVCIKALSLTCTTCFDQMPDCRVYSNGSGLCGSCNDTEYGVAINPPNFICVKCPVYCLAIFVLPVTNWESQWVQSSCTVS